MVLIVDDQPLIGQATEMLLAHGGYDATYANGGAAALDWLRNGTPLLVLLDWMMPDVSGLEVLMAIRNNPRIEAVPVIVVSGANAEQIARDLGKLKIQGIISKPDVADKLISSVSAYLPIP